MAIIELSQASVPASVEGTRYDLVPREVIVCTATTPAPGPGVVHTWEILDKAGSDAVLDATVASTVNLGVGGDSINPYCAFKIKLTSNDNGAVTESIIVAGVPHALGLMDSWGSPESIRYLVPAMFGETSDPLSTIDANDPTVSTDNFSRELADTGVTGANWRGWSTKDYDAKKRLLDQTFVQGWEVPVVREAGDAAPNYTQLFDIPLLTMHQYFPMEMWGEAPTFEIEIAGRDSLGNRMNLQARVQYNVMRAFNRDEGGLPGGGEPDGVHTAYTEYECEALPSVDPPETVMSPETPGGPDYFYDGDGSEPDSIYLLPYLRRIGAGDWAIALRLVFDETAFPPPFPGIMNLKVRVKPKISITDQVGYVDPDYSEPS